MAKHYVDVIMHTIQTDVLKIVFLKKETYSFLPACYRPKDSVEIIRD